MTYHGNSTICTKYDELHEHRSGETTKIEKDEFWNEQKVREHRGLKLPTPKHKVPTDEWPIHRENYGAIGWGPVVPTEFRIQAFFSSRIPTQKFWPFGPNSIQFFLVPRGLLAGTEWAGSGTKALVGQKSKFALQIVSKCGASSARDILTAQLGQLVPVDVFGACSGNECDEQCYGQQMKSHFFYLAFENSVCSEYVTEKFWNALRSLTVPVVLHRTVLRGVGVPDDAYIAADDFCSVQELAQHLLALRRDTDKYIQ
ncbi:hypothetical protein niasHT_036198 [Heterodera trifolii]|uniref:Fucosyltransferase n=1 Tax=Heterodera trifolii TaxID=157864 RepID=A0ABD2IMT7_9BILA